MSANAGLFENDRESNFDSTVAMVEDVLIELGHFVNDCRIDQPGTKRAWRIRKGSAEVLVVLVDRADFVHVIASSTVLTMDERVDEKALFRRLLELNHNDLAGAAFGLAGRYVRVVSERSTLDLDRSELLDLIGRIQRYADDYDDALTEEFGGSIGGPID